MKLTADENGSLTSAELFRPNTAFDARRQPDGSIRVMELKEIPVVKPRRIAGRLRGADIALNRETVATAIRAERDER